MKEVLLATLALGVGNFTFQWLFTVSPNYEVAAERTFFQFVAVLLFVLSFGSK